MQPDLSDPGPELVITISHYPESKSEGKEGRSLQKLGSFQHTARECLFRCTQMEYVPGGRFSFSQGKLEQRTIMRVDSSQGLECGCEMRCHENRRECEKEDGEEKPSLC